MKMNLTMFRLYEKPAASERKPDERSFPVEMLTSKNSASSTRPKPIAPQADYYTRGRAARTREAITRLPAPGYDRT